MLDRRLGARRARRSGRSSLADRLNELAAQHEAEGATVSLEVRDAATGELLLGRHEHARLVTASTMKLSTTAQALATFGPDFRFQTRVKLDGRLRRGAFDGDLKVEASGDPSLGSWRWPETDAAEVCSRVSKALAARGVRTWRGSITLAEPADGRAPLGPGWAWDDALYDFSAPPTRFVFRENMVSLTVTRKAKRCRKPPELSFEPALTSIRAVVTPEDRANGPALACRRDPGSSDVSCSWRIHEKSCPHQSSLAIPHGDPLGAFAACVDDALKKARIRHVRSGRHKPAPGELETLVELASPPLAELVKATNKESLNLYAERLARSLTQAARKSEDYDDVRAYMGEVAAARGLAPREMLQVDGSGLSRYNLASAHALTTIVRHGLAQPSFEDSLPIAGVDGTLAKRLAGSEAKGHVHAKTGSMSGVRSWAGVAERPGDPKHPRLLFALILGQLVDPSIAPGETFERAAEALVNAPIR